MMLFMSKLHRIPPPTFENLETLNAMLGDAVAKPPQMRLNLVSGVLDEGWIQALIKMVDDLREEEGTLDKSEERWTKLFQLFKYLVLLDPRQVCSRLMRDDVFLHVFGVLEHDPG